MIGHLASATAAALVAIVLVLSIRGPRAAIRHAILLAALLRFAVPTSWLTIAGSRATACIPVRANDDLRALLIGPGRIAITGIRSTPPMSGNAASSRTEWTLPEIALGALWALGALLLAIRWFGRSRDVATLVREPLDCEINAFERGKLAMGVQGRIRLKIVQPDSVPCLRGVVLPSIDLPDGLSAQLTDSELESVIAHELAHLKRLDNPVAFVARSIVTVFWFHPLVWWIADRMLLEREEACDAMVVASGSERTDYVSAMAKICQMALTGGSPLAGITGTNQKSNLARRMENVMALDVKKVNGRAARAAFAASLTLTALLPITAGFLRAQQPEIRSNASNNVALEACFALLKAGHFDEAEAAYLRIEQADPADPRAFMGRIQVRLRQNHPNDAIAFVRGRTEEEPSRLDLRLALGDVEMLAKQFNAALAEYQYVADHMDANAAANLFWPMMAGRNPLGAQKGTAVVYMRIAEAQRRLGNTAAQIDAWRKVAEVAPAAPVFRELGITLEGAGQQLPAIDQYRAALRLDPNDALALNNLAYLITVTGGSLDEALSDARRAEQLLPKFAEVRDTVGWVLMKQGTSDEAIAKFSSAVVDDPRREEFRTHLVAALDQKGDRSARSTALRSALLSPSTPENDKQVLEMLGSGK